MRVDYAVPIKLHGNPARPDTRYGPGVCIGTESCVISGNPNPQHTSTSYVERQSLTMRASMRRFTRLTNAFSKKIDNHSHAVARYFMYCHFCRVHQTIRVTPAMEAGIADHIWGVEELVQLLKQRTAQRYH
jgi:hypothetical protein